MSIFHQKTINQVLGEFQINHYSKTLIICYSLFHQKTINQVLGEFQINHYSKTLIICYSLFLF